MPARNSDRIAITLMGHPFCDWAFDVVLSLSLSHIPNLIFPPEMDIIDLLIKCHLPRMNFSHKRWHFENNNDNNNDDYLSALHCLKTWLRQDVFNRFQLTTLCTKGLYRLCKMPYIDYISSRNGAINKWLCSLNIQVIELSFCGFSSLSV